MKCPQCIKEGKRSTVTWGTTFTNAIYYPITYDEDGNIVNTSHATSKTSYYCSNGHEWIENT